MLFSRCARWSRVVRGLFAAILLAVVAADPAAAEIIRVEDMLRGIRMTREECAAKPQTFWLNIYGRDYCLRYYLSTAGGEGTRPVIILNGDSLGPISLKNWTWKNPSESKDDDTDKLQRVADRFSKSAKTTAIYIGRIGVEGTSGSHLARKTLVEVNLMDAGLDALRKRHQFEGFHLVGQSGGGKLVFGLAELRRDVGCLISTSGGLISSPSDKRTNDPAKTYFDIEENIKFLARNRDLRIIVISDPDDKQVSAAKKQAPMVDSLREEGQKVLHLEVAATDAKRHGTLFAYGTVAMAACVAKKTDDEIMQVIDKVVDTKIEFNQRRESEAREKSVGEPAFRAPNR
jgi:pimeloyl-ACP methyl ester carboxylesterase